jgi:serine/threonine protein kinase
MTDLIGKTLGRYQIVEQIGQGGMAEVYKGYQPLLDRYVAIKVLHAFMLADPANRDRFQREARSVATLRHPNIVQVFDFDASDNTYFMVMEYVDGPALKAVMQEQARKGSLLPVERTAEIITAVGNALGYAHNHGMIHRDVKPHNIMFTAAGQPLLADFGIAKILNTTSISDPNTISGTPAYMSPEQGRGNPLDARTDLYSLGIVLYELITGRVPFEADIPYAVVYKHIDEPVPSPHTFVDGLPEHLANVLYKALEKKPDDRYQTAEEMVAAVQDAVAEARRSGTVLTPRNVRPAEAAPRQRPTPASGTPAIPAPPAGGTVPRPASLVNLDTPPPDAAPAAAPPPVMSVFSASSTPVNLRRTGDSVTVKLGDAMVAAEAGGRPVETTATISNPRQEQNQEQYNFEVEDLDPSWYSLDVKSVVLWQGGTAQVKITFAIPRRSTTPGSYVYRVKATSVKNPAISGHIVGKLLVSSTPALQMSLEPPRATGETAQYAVNLSNGPVGAVIVQLEARDPSGVLEFTVNPDRRRLGPNEEGTMDLVVGVRHGAVGEPRIYPFTVVARVTGGEEGASPIEAPAEFVHVPPVQIGLRVEVEPIHSELGNYHIILTNPTSLTLDVTLDAEDPENALKFFLQEEVSHLQLARESTETVDGIIRLLGGVPAAARTYPFTIGAHARNVEGPGELNTSIEGELVYEPPTQVVVDVPDLLAHVQMNLAPSEAAGDPARFSVQLENNGPQAVLAVLRAHDADNLLDCACDPPQIYLAPSEKKQSNLSVRRRADAPADSERVAFEVVCGAPGGRPDRVLTCQGTFLAAPPAPAFEAILVPIEPSGSEGTYDVRLINGGKVPISVILRGRDTSGLLTFQFAAPRVALPPGSEKTVRLIVHPNALEPLSEEHTYPFDVICWIPSTNEARTLGGEILYISF